jgi:Protein of unknown function (DUF3223)
VAGQQVIIGSGEFGFERVFKSKNEAALFFREMLRQYRSDQEIGEQDSQLLRALLERHPEAHQKIGIGIKRFFRAAAIYGTDCFWLERDDGTRTDFSYQSCVDAKGKSLYQEFAEACKEAVQPELTAAKKSTSPNMGMLTGWFDVRLRVN